MEWAIFEYSNLYNFIRLQNLKYHLSS
jgi:hypothetical protein